MKLATLLSITFAAVGCTAPSPSPRSPYVVHERRYGNSALHQAARVDPKSLVTFHIGLKQRNLENGHAYLMNVSHPSSPRYGKLWTAEQVRATFAPSEDSISRVQAWLESSGIEDVVERKGWLSFKTTIAHVEALMESEYYEHEDHETGAVRIGCERYHLPQDISKHIDFVTPGVVLSEPLEKTTLVKRSTHPWPHWPRPSWPHPKLEGHHGQGSGDHAPGARTLPPDLQHCGHRITPPCLRALYGLPSAEEIAESYDNDPVNTIGVFEADSVYNQSDMNLFFKKWAPNVPAGTHPTLNAINGAVLYRNLTQPYIYDTEANVDFQIIYALLYPQKVTLYQETPNYGNPIFERGGGFSGFIGDLLDALDGSFCSEKDKALGKDCGVYTLTRVISISYGKAEIDYPETQQRRQCHEFMKLGLQGHTFTVASGDYGVADRPGRSSPNISIPDTNGCITPRNYKATTAFGGPTLNGTVFNPIFPQNCPYVLSVGGTQLNRDDTVLDPESAMNPPTYNHLLRLDGIPDLVSTSGGFSNYFNRPDYQQAAVDKYFQHYDPGYPYYNFNGIDASQSGTNIGANGGRYNRLGRGFPDVSANGAYFVDADNDILAPQGFGTSLAAPIWASVITLINEKRTEMGKGPVGFINPVLYEHHSEILNDIVKGSNPGCFTKGFSAVKGWDPVTGLGTPNYHKMLELFLSLP